MNVSATTGDSGIERDLALLEGRLGTLVEHTRALRAANESLRRDLAAAQERNRELAERVAAAARELDGLLERLPTTTE
jgi:cell division protein FtsB